MIEFRGSRGLEQLLDGVGAPSPCFRQFSVGGCAVREDEVGCSAEERGEPFEEMSNDVPGHPFGDRCGCSPVAGAVDESLKTTGNEAMVVDRFQDPLPIQPSG